MVDESFRFSQTTDMSFKPQHKTMKRRAIDPSGQLLSFYDGYHDQIIKRKHMTFKEQHLEAEEPPVCNIINGQDISREQLLHYVGIEDEQRLSLLLNLTTRQGIAQVLNHPATLDQYTRILYYRWIRKISTFHESIKWDQVAREFATVKNATHVISEISYGIDLLIIFNSPADIQSIQMIDTVLDTIRQQLLHDQGYQSMSHIDIDTGLTRIPLPFVYSNLQDLQGRTDMAHVLRRINESKRTTNLSSPIEYTLRPLTDFSSYCSLAFCGFHPIVPTTCQRIEDYLTPWRHALRTLETSDKDYQPSSSTSQFHKQIKAVKDTYMAETKRLKLLVIEMREKGKSARLIDLALVIEKQRSEMNKIRQLTEQIRSLPVVKTPSLRLDQDTHTQRGLSSAEYPQVIDIERIKANNIQRHRSVSSGKYTVKNNAKNNRASSQSRLESTKKSSIEDTPSLSTRLDKGRNSRLLHSDRPYNPYKYLVDDLEILPSGTVGHHDARSASSRPSFTLTTRRTTMLQPVVITSKDYPDPTSGYDIHRLPSPRLAFDERNDSSVDPMTKPTTRKSRSTESNTRRYSLSSLEGAPDIGRPFTKAVNLKSAYNDQHSFDSKKRTKTVRSRSNSTDSQTKQTTDITRPRSVPTKRDQTDQPTITTNAASIASTSDFESKTKKTRSRSPSPSRKQAPLPTRNDVTTASPFETLSTQSTTHTAKIMSPRSRDQSDRKSTNQLAQRDEMKSLVRNPPFHQSKLLQSPRLSSNISGSHQKSTTMDKIQTTESNTTIGIAIKVKQPIHDRSSHSAQDQSLTVQSIRPVPPTHLDTPKFSPSTPASTKPQEGRTINILLFGQTGVGKSTFINAFANYLVFSSLEQAQTGTPLVIIPVSFIITSGFYFDEQKITFGPQDPSNNENFNDQGHSVTQQCRTYTFDLPERNQRVCIIDTPGFGDTRGIEQDKINIKHINDYIAQLPRVDAICCLFKPNESKIDILFRTCFMQLFSIIGEDVYDKVMFCFTNSRSTFYAPGNTGPLLKKMLETVKNGQVVKMEKKNTFCFDNEAFRYLVARQNGVEFGDGEQQEYAKSWERSVQESKRLIDTIQGEQQRIEQIHGLVRPILEIIRNSLRNVILHQKNSSSRQIEVYSVKPEDISARCRKCPTHSEQINGFWINVDKPHYIDEHCISCECPNEDHEQMKHVLRYRLKEQIPENDEETLQQMLEMLSSMVVILNHFLQLNRHGGYQDPFVERFREVIEEEKNLSRTRVNAELNQELSGRLHIQLKTYENEVKEMEKKGEGVDSSRLDKVMKTLESLPMISQLLETNQSSKRK